MTNNLLGGGVPLAGYLGALPFAMFRGLLFLLLLAILRALVRRPLLAAVIAGVIIASMTMPRGAHVYTSWLAIGIGCVAVGVWVMTRTRASGAHPEPELSRQGPRPIAS